MRDAFHIHQLLEGKSIARNDDIIGTMQALRPLARAAPLARSFSTSAPRSLAKMQLIGRLADAPEIQATSTGRDIVRYALGVSYGSKDESGNRPVSWFRVASFIDEGPQRDLLTNLPKG